MSQHTFLPVSLQPRHDGWTPEKQWRFIERLAATASVHDAAWSVGMSPRSAQRLRRHPGAEGFRAAWDAALGQAWGQLEQVALDRAINGEKEIVRRDGDEIIERRRPCSDRLMIYLLGVRERAMTRAREERLAAHQRAIAEARLATIKASVATRGRKARGAPAAAPAIPALPSDADADTAALATLRAHARSLVEWPPMEDTDAVFDFDEDGHIPLTPHHARHNVLASEARHPEPEFDYETRPRWEDYR